MKKNKKILTLIVAGILSIATIAGCTKAADSSEIKGTEIEKYFAASTDNPLKDWEYVVQIDDYKVSPDEYRYMYENSKAKYAYYMGGEEVFETDPSLIATVQEDALSALQYNVATLRIAEIEGISLDDTDLEAMNNELTQTIEQLGGRSAYETALAESHLTEDLYHYVVKLGYLKEKIYNQLFIGDGKYAVADDVLMEAASNYLRAKHILIKPEDTESDESWEAAKTKAMEVYELAVAGDDFDALITEYGEDPGMTSNPNGYYFVEGDMVTEFYEGTLSLDENKIGAPVKSTFGYHIILRLPVEKEYVLENSDQFLGDVILENYYALLDSYKVEQTLDFNPGYDGITIVTFSKGE